MKIGRRILTHLSVLFSLIVVGAVGFGILEDKSFLTSLYFTIITVTTVGYGDVTPLSMGGKIFATFIALAGVGIFFYVFTSVTQVIIEGEFREIVWRRRMEKVIKGLKDHYIICGYGKTGSQICRELSRGKRKFLVVEKDIGKAEAAVKEGFLVLQGDATQESVLEEAGIATAKGIAAITGSDATNVFIVLTSRGMNSSLFILGRFEEDETQRKLERAGADRTVSPHHIGGLRMASMLLKPNVCDFIELATMGSSLDLQMEEITLKEGSKFADKTIGESSIRKEHGVIIVAVKKKGKTIFNPSPDTSLHSGDLLIVIGKPEEVERMERGEEG